MLYELTCLINPDLNENELGEFSDKLSKSLSESGKIIKTESSRRVKLQYKIKQYTNAFLLSFVFETEPEKLENLKVQLDKDASIVRFLLIKIKIEKDPTPRDMIKKEAVTSKETETKEQDKGAEKEKPQPKEKITKTEDKVSMEKIETELNKILDES